MRISYPGPRFEEETLGSMFSFCISKHNHGALRLRCDAASYWSDQPSSDRHHKILSHYLKMSQKIL